MKKLILLTVLLVAFSCSEDQNPVDPTITTWDIKNPNPNYLTEEQRHQTNTNDPCPYYKTWWTKFKLPGIGQQNPYLVNTWGYGQAVGANISHGYRVSGTPQEVHRNTSTFECRNAGSNPLDMYFNGSSTPIRISSGQAVNMVIVSAECVTNTTYSFPVIIRKVSGGSISIAVTNIFSLEGHGISSTNGVGFGIN